MNRPEPDSPEAQARSRIDALKGQLATLDGDAATLAAGVARLQADIERYGCPVGTLTAEMAKLGHPARAEAVRKAVVAVICSFVSLRTSAPARKYAISEVARTADARNKWRSGWVTRPKNPFDPAYPAEAEIQGVATPAPTIESRE